METSQKLGYEEMKLLLNHTAAPQSSTEHNPDHKISLSKISVRFGRYIGRFACGEFTIAR